MDSMRLVTALFKNKISFEEISYFRGSIIRLSGNEPLFHNHDQDGYHYTYPLVQYKRIGGCAAIVGINEGADAVESLFEGKESYHCQLGNRKLEMELVAIRAEKVSIRCREKKYTYSISRWIPLNSENYQVFQQTEGIVERVGMLEKILIGNILSLAKGVGVYFDSPVTCRILQLEHNGLTPYKEVELMSYSAVFQCNVQLPEYVGLGKSASLGYGIVIHAIT